MEFTDPAEQAWYDSQPPLIQRLIRQLPPHGKYRWRDDETEDWYVIESYCDDGTVTVVYYSGRDELRPIGPPTEDQWVWKRRGEPVRRVFGVAPDDLIPIASGGEPHHD
jgi:hypothetical protein